MQLALRRCFGKIDTDHVGISTHLAGGAGLLLQRHAADAAIVEHGETLSLTGALRLPAATAIAEYQRMAIKRAPVQCGMRQHRGLAFVKHADERVVTRPE